MHYDNDTVSALVGAAIGALHGVDAPPPQLTERPRLKRLDKRVGTMPSVSGESTHAVLAWNCGSSSHNAPPAAGTGAVDGLWLRSWEFQRNSLAGSRAISPTHSFMARGKRKKLAEKHGPACRYGICSSGRACGSSVCCAVSLRASEQAWS